ncbi:hypothetical protein XENOCAPTIV_028965, partial [Xenoophorus captivus]
GRSFTWLGNEDVKYSNWKDGEPNQMAGCGHMITTGEWTMTPCDAKLEAAICQISGAETSSATCKSLFIHPFFDFFSACSVLTVLSFFPVDVDHLPTLIVVIVTSFVLVLLIATVIYLYRRRTAGSHGSFEGARYSRTNSGHDEQAEKNILVSDMELNEQPE